MIVIINERINLSGADRLFLSDNIVNGLTKYQDSLTKEQSFKINYIRS